MTEFTKLYLGYLTEKMENQMRGLIHFYSLYCEVMLVRSGGLQSHRVYYILPSVKRLPFLPLLLSPCLFIILLSEFLSIHRSSCEWTYSGFDHRAKNKISEYLSNQVETSRHLPRSSLIASWSCLKVQQVK